MLNLIPKLLKKFYLSSLILMYHRINKEEMDPWSLCVSPEHFEEHLSVIRTYANPISLQQLLIDLKEGKVSPGSIVITFDDGYLDNLIYAKPLLEKYNIPASFFITAGMIGGKKEFWWDQLEQIFLTPGKLPERLTLEIEKEIFKWNLGNASTYSEDDYKKDFKKKVWRSPKGTRHFLYHSIWEKLQPLTVRQKEDFVKDLAEWSGTELSVRETHSIVSENELKELQRGEIFEIGAHTITHPALSAIPGNEQEREISESKKSLETIFNFPVRSFAYPHGDYNNETIDILKRNGFNCSVTTSGRPLKTSSGFFELSRIHIEDISGKNLLKIFEIFFGKRKIKV